MEPYIIVCKYFKQYTCTHDFYICLILHTGVDPGFQVRGGVHLKKLGRAEGGTKFFWVFRVKNHDFMPKNHFFFQF
jgi:hypothetical protein